MSDNETVPISEEALTKYSAEFDQLCIDRHEMGAEKYGPVKFLEVSSLRMAMEEVVDLANYARYAYIKFRILEEGVAQLESLDRLSLDLNESVEAGKQKLTDQGIDYHTGVRFPEGCGDPNCAVDHSVNERPK